MAGRAKVALVGRGLALILAPRDARAWQAHAGVALAARGDANVRAAASDRKAGSVGGQVQVDAWKHADSTLKPGAHSSTVMARRVADREQFQTAAHEEYGRIL